MSDIQKNSSLTLDIEEMNNLGAGVAHAPDGRVVFCTGAVEGDRVRAKVIKVCASYLVARCEEIITPSPHRVSEDLCAYPLSCGGCVWRSVTYEHELVSKREYVKNAFRKAGLPDVDVTEVATTGRIYNYRNKAQYPLTTIDGRVRAGFFAPKTHRIVPAERCVLAPEIFGDIVEYFCSLATDLSLDVYDEESGRGLLRHLYLRSTSAGEVMVCIVINAEGFPKETEVAHSLCEKFPNITGVLVNVNKKNTNVVLGDKYRTLCGKDTIEDTLCDK
jgi:23S rRNA (uracil1939-C5)-methyltransferase